jgi:SecD/SecF fusion protein
MKFSPIRAIIIAIVAISGILLTIPSFLPKDVLATWPSFLPRQSVVLGLDLQGGSHLLLQVNRDSIVAERIKELRRDVRSKLANDNGIGNLITTAADSISVELTDPTQKDKALAAIETLQSNVSGTFGVGGVPELAFSESPDGKLVVTLTPDGIKQRMSALVAQSIEVIRNRIDEVGTTEPTIQRQGQDRVLVQVPGFEDSGRLKELISRTARLTFHLVHPTMTADQAEAQGVPAGFMVLPSADGGKELLNETAELGGESLTNAQPGFDQQGGRSIVSFTFDTRGAIAFGEITSKNVGKRFAIVLDDQVITAPVIQTAITGGSGQISGNFTPQSASDLAVLLRAGALPATLDIVEERSVGPSLGADSIRSGITAGIVAGVLVVSFMIAAYGLFGVFAVSSLILNVILMLAALSALGATLTLPGMAGIVLTIGVAVDANVLIYERIREEINAGKSPIAAINAGFERAWGTIVDSHLTQLIAAIVLYFLGSGPIQGFAVTLALGILISLFTAYTVTLFQVGIWFRARRPKTLKIQIFRFVPDDTKIPFMKLARPVMVFSVVMMVLSVGSAFVKGFNLGIDFKGGSAIEIQHTGGPADPADLREVLGALDLGEVQVQSFGSPEDVLVRIEEQPGGDTAQQAAVEKFRVALAADNYEIRRTEAVSGTVSGELALSGTLAVLVSLIAILAYVWFRFEWQFAVGAIITTAHDVILTIGLFSITGLEFNLTSIAAVLTLVGLSLNDTVVIYDRIRENLRKYKKMPLPELIDLSINSTLARTTLTAATNFMALIPLMLFGGEVIRGFVTAMTFGLFVGTYSSIIVGAPLLMFFGLKSRADIADDGKAVEKRADGASV